MTSAQAKRAERLTRQVLASHLCPLCEAKLLQLDVTVDCTGVGRIRFWCEGCGATIIAKDPTLASSLAKAEATIREAERKERMKTARKEGKR